MADIDLKTHSHACNQMSDCSHTSPLSCIPTDRISQIPNSQGEGNIGRENVCDAHSREMLLLHKYLDTPADI